jgi:hypothetical protein
MLKISALYLEKQKSFIPKQKNFWSHCQYQNKKALFTDPIFSEDLTVTLLCLVPLCDKNSLGQSKMVLV